MGGEIADRVEGFRGEALQQEGADGIGNIDIQVAVPGKVSVVLDDDIEDGAGLPPVNGHISNINEGSHKQHDQRDGDHRAGHKASFQFTDRLGVHALLRGQTEASAPFSLDADAGGNRGELVPQIADIEPDRIGMGFFLLPDRGKKIFCRQFALFVQDQRLHELKFLQGQPHGIFRGELECRKGVLRGHRIIPLVVNALDCLIP